jgi:signal transduction histidine kinase
MRIGMLLAMQLAIAIRNARRFEEINGLYIELEQAYQALSRAERLRQDMTDMIVHDLRNPLSVIVTALDLSNRKLPGEQSAKFKQEMQTSAKAASNRMMNLIEDLLTISKLDAGELKLKLVSIDLSHLFEEKKTAYQTLAAQERKQVRVETGDLPSLIADETLISRVLDNLVANAFKFTRAGRGQIELSVSHKEDVLQFCVRDNGDGIAPEYHETIFDRFKQVTDNRGMPLRHGTGLGLAFSRMVIEAHGGEIWLESVPDQGSTFYFTLPLSNQPSI